MLRFLLKSPITELALDVTFRIWLFHFRTEVMVSPRYIVVSVIQGTWPWSIFMDGSIFDLTSLQNICRRLIPSTRSPPTWQFCQDPFGAG